jgi:hypothetical protein
MCARACLINLVWQNRPQHNYFSFALELTSRVHQGLYGEFKYPVCSLWRQKQDQYLGVLFKPTTMVHFLWIARICSGLFLSECKFFFNLAWNCDLATIFKVLMGKRWFYNDGKSENFEIPFSARTIHQWWSRVHQKMQNINIGGGGYVF